MKKVSKKEFYNHLDSFQKRVQFFLFLAEAGEAGKTTLTPFTYWESQFKLLEHGVRDGRIHDAALVAYSRLA